MSALPCRCSCLISYHYHLSSTLPNKNKLFFFMNAAMLHSPRVEKPLIKPKKLFNIKCCQRKRKKIICKKYWRPDILFYPIDKLMKWFLQQEIIFSICHRIRIFNCEKHAGKFSQLSVFFLHVWVSIAWWFVLLTWILACVSSCIFCMVWRKR